MKTPLKSAVDAYIAKDRARFHMPGHKGKPIAFNPEACYDITEVDGCDELYRPRCAIAQLQARYARLYKSAAALLSAGGATLCIQAMLAAAVESGGSLVCVRGCHTAAVNAMALLDISPSWVFPEVDENTGLAMPVTAKQIEAVLAQNPAAKAVYVTSPDYYGQICDIKAISQMCQKYGVYLLVDNAHGAHLRFLNPSMHPMELGADFCCDSLHKSLPVLTGGAMLYLKDESYYEKTKQRMSMFGSTSPSYLIMLSADTALDELENGYEKKIAATAEQIKELGLIARSRGFITLKGLCDPVKLTLGFRPLGYAKDEFLKALRQNQIEPELTDDGFCVFMASTANSLRDFDLLRDFIVNLPSNIAIPASEKYCDIRPQIACGLRRAMFSPVERVALSDAGDRIAGSTVIPCPPGTHLLIPGEKINKKMMHVLKKSGISHLNVLK